MKSYIFVLGRTPELAFLELKTFSPSAVRVACEIAVADTFVPIDKLGGTVKIARLLGPVSHPNAQELIAFFPEKKETHFGVSMYGDALPLSLLPDLKKLLEARGMHARYASSRHGETLSSVTVSKQHIYELILIKTPDRYLVGETEVVQDFEAWAKRDYGRPYADAKSGMLPPKVARMLVNIAGSPSTLLDPFCGMGTILTEAYLSGWRVLGSDISSETLRKAQANLDWVGAKGKLFVSDATHVSNVLPQSSVDAIVTEPFMGKTNGSDPKNAIKGLEKLYIGCLRDWRKILVPGGLVIIALPEYAVGGRVYFVKKVIDMCETLGYTIDAGPIAYNRPQAIVRRQFYKLIWHT